MLSVLPKTEGVLEEEHGRGHHLGAQVYVRLGEETIVDEGWGENRPGVPISPDDISLWLSATKPVVAIAFAQLVERGVVDLDVPVAQIIPEFAQSGKDRITFHHVLTHTGGFRKADVSWDDDSWEDILAVICRTPPESDWRPGEKAGYHVATGWYVLGESIQRLTDRSLPEILRSKIFDPLGMDDSWLGIPPASYHSYGDRISPSYDATRNLEPHTFFNSEEGAAVVRPGGNGRGPVRDLGRLYAALLGGGSLDGQRILKPDTVSRFISRQRTGLYDHTFRHQMDWGFGFILNSARYDEARVPYGYGPHASQETFGHSGWQSACAFADPEHKLVVAWVCNGAPGEPRHHRRQRALNRAIYEDLGIA